MREEADFRTGDGEGGEDVFSKVVRAGKRTYFFDVKATRNGNDYYLIITESRKRAGRDGMPVFDKNKIFLYKEDFEKFADGFEDALAYIKTHKPELFETELEAESEQMTDEDLIEAEFAML
jgi:hypothetical protein